MKKSVPRVDSGKGKCTGKGLEAGKGLLALFEDQEEESSKVKQGVVGDIYRSQVLRSLQVSVRSLHFAQSAMGKHKDLQGEID